MTLADIEAAADALPANEKQELLLFLAARLRATVIGYRTRVNCLASR